MNYSLSNTSLGIDGFTSTLAHIQHAYLIGDDRDNTFTVSNWSGDAVIDGGNGFDQTTVNLGGGGTVTLAPPGPIGGDAITINNDDPGGTIAITPTQTSRGAEVVRYPSTIDSLTVNAGAGDPTVDLMGTAQGLTAIHGGSGTTTLNVFGTSDFTETTYGGGPGNSIVQVGQGAAPADLAGLAASPSAIAGGLILTGGAGRNTLRVDLPGDLSNLLQVDGFDQGSTIAIHGNLDFGLIADAKSITTVDVAGSLGAYGVIQAGAIDQVNVGGSLDGAVDVSGPIGTITVGGSLFGSGSVDATSLGALHVGGNLKGTVDVTGTIGQISVAGATPGAIVANHVGVVSASAATGPTLLDIVEAGVTRRVVVTPVLAGGPSASAAPIRLRLRLDRPRCAGSRPAGGQPDGRSLRPRAGRQLGRQLQPGRPRRRGALRPPQSRDRRRSPQPGHPGRCEEDRSLAAGKRRGEPAGRSARRDRGQWRHPCRFGPGGGRAGACVQLAFRPARPGPGRIASRPQGCGVDSRPGDATGPG